MAAGHGNFASLSERWPALAAAGTFADRHADSEPVAAAIQLRLFVEQLVKQLYRRWRLQPRRRAGIGTSVFVDDRHRARVAAGEHLTGRVSSYQVNPSDGQRMSLDVVFDRRNTW